MIDDFNYLLGLKEVYRHRISADRQDSTAGHTWGCLLLADYYVDTVEEDVDRDRVFQLLLYHDIVELEAGDVPLIDQDGGKEVEERSAMETITETLPSDWSERYRSCYEEFERRETVEARFAHAVDKLEPLMQWADVPEKLEEKGYTKEFL